ncbi:MAG: hypothetical protein AABW83_02740 [Nanoarchaeota archaeon]
MNKKIILLSFSIIFLFFVINTVEATICKGWDGYYHDCYYDYGSNYQTYKRSYYIDDIYLNKYYINNDYKYKIYSRHLEKPYKIHVIKDERDYEINVINNNDVKFNIYLDKPDIKIRKYKTKYTEDCPEGFSCIKTNYIRIY